MSTSPKNEKPYRVTDLNYVSLYLMDLEGAVSFYTHVFGAPEFVREKPTIHGWRMGSTWLTLFPSAIAGSKTSNPCNAEFAIQVSHPKEVDALYEALIKAGAKECMSPSDTEMYEPMRFACVDDPFGVRVDVYCPIGRSES